MSPLINIIWPKWLPEPVKAFIQEEYELGRAHKINILPAFLEPQMESVWEKIAKLSEATLSEYGLCICYMENHFKNAKEETDVANDEAVALETALKKTKAIKSLIQKRLKYAFIYSKLLDDAQNLITLLEESYEYAKIRSSESAMNTEFGDYGKLTRKKKGENAFITCFARGLSDAIRRHTSSSYNEEIATTINVIFKAEYTGDHIKKLVGTHTQKGKIRAKK